MWTLLTVQPLATGAPISGVTGTGANIWCHRDRMSIDCARATCSPTPPPAASNCAWTAPKCRSDVRARASRAAARSCQARRSRTRKRPPSSPTGKAAPCGPARSAQGGCTTRPRCGPRASPTCSPSSQVKAKVDAGYRGLAKEFPDQVQARRSSRRRTPLRKKPQPTRPTPQAVIGTDLRRARQRRAQAMANPPALPRTTRRLRRDLPGRRRPGLRPRRRTVTPRQPTPPGQHGPPLIAHYVVCRLSPAHLGEAGMLSGRTRMPLTVWFTACGSPRPRTGSRR